MAWFFAVVGLLRTLLTVACPAICQVAVKLQSRGIHSVLMITTAKSGLTAAQRVLGRDSTKDEHPTTELIIS